MDKSTTIHTKNSKGTVHTSYSDDPFHRIGWQTFLSVTDPIFPIERMVEVLVTDSWEEAVKNHQTLCNQIKE